MDDIILFAKNEKELETLIQAVRNYSLGIGMEFDIEKWCHANKEKQRMAHDWRNEITKQWKN